jgi:tellurite resistance protein TerC
MFAPTVVGWTTTLAVIGGLVAFDLWHSVRHRRAIGWRAAAGWSLFYVAIAALFGVVFALSAGWDLGTQYFAGYIVERSLSLDNLFVFGVGLTATLR